MIDFNVKPREKSEQEKTFDKLNEEYTEKFGEPYTFSIGIDGMTWEETLSDIRRRIAENDPQTEPEYESGKVY